MGFARSLYERFAVLIHEAAKFGVVGAIGFVVSLGGADLLHFNLGVGKYTSVVIATVLATIVTFIGNRWWAFRHRERTRMGQETVLFFVFNGIGLLIQLACVAIVVDGFNLQGSKLWYNVANLDRHRAGHAVPVLVLPQVGVEGRAGGRRPVSRPMPSCPGPVPPRASLRPAERCPAGAARCPTVSTRDMSTPGRGPVAFSKMPV